MTMLDYKGMLGKLVSDYGGVDCLDLSNRQLGQLRDGLKAVTPAEITSANDGKRYIQLLRKYREAVAENDKLHGDNYPKLLNSLLSVGEDGLYSDPLRFIFELIQNVDDCEYQSTDDCKLDMWFDFNGGKIVLTYNETGFTPFNVFAVTGIAERAKNISASKNEIGEKGIGFKSVFGVAECVLIRSGWFSFELHRDNFTIPIASYSTDSWCEGTEMTLYVQGRIQEIYRRIKAQYCNKDALFSRNPLLFLNKLTSLKMYFDRFRGMEFRVSRPKEKAWVERDVVISADLRDHDIERGIDLNEKMRILCTRYTYPVTYSPEACRARYGEKTEIGRNGGKKMLLQVVMPNVEHLGSIGTGSLYSFLPTQLKLTVPAVCHVPFKLDASREFVDPQKNDLWFRESVKYLSSLMDYAYSDWCQEVKETIVRYLPSKRESLFAPNNGKEKCLSELVCFRGEHFLELPLFLTTDHTFKTAQEIFSFAQDEDIIDPETVCRLMEYPKALFIPSAAVQCSNFGIEIERNANLQLFETALKKETITAEALDYLDQVEFQCSETLVSQQGRLELSPGQIHALMRYDRFAEPFQKMACQRIRQNRRPEFSIIGVPLQRITDVLDDGFELGETPEKVENYFKYCGEACVCLDIGEKGFLPCKNGVVLSSKNILSSFAAFCSAIDDKDTFAIRVRLREASARLDRCVEDSSGSAEDYLRQLKNIRLSVKDSLGRSYKGYISRILEAGTNKGRFVQELLQNADDCQYPKGTKPAFRLKPRDSSVVIEYNEIGFTRSDIRAITAIGESTKNKMLSGSAGAIGEKGVGFKMVFGVASEVKISSGEYHFLLTDREPTIPKRLETQPAKTDGTRMELILKEREDVPSFSEKSILELCLCLRKLKELEFGVHKVSICDTEDSRVITIDKKRHVFKRFVHSFTIEDEAALNERRDETREVSTQQQIICYVPEGNKSAEYYLYAGLPIQHRFNVPLVIDAPFILTTSREQIKTAASPWNDCVRRELYEAIQGVIDALKGEQRASIFQYMRFLPRRQGMLQIYVNAISDCDYLNAYPFREVLRSCEILPTFDREVFARPAEGTALRYSDATNALCSLLSPSDFSNTDLSAIIDVPGKDYEAILNALGCMPADFGTEFDLLSNYVEHFIGNEEFRPKLYEFLLGRPEAYCERIRKYAIIPVLGKANDSVDYVPWKDDSIFVKPGASVSDRDYHILNEQLLPKSDCEKILGVNINEISEEWERARYNERLRQIIRGSDIDTIYEYLMKEYCSGSLEKNISRGTLLESKEFIPLKNQLGEIVNTELFLCDQPEGYFPVEMIKKITVHKECEDLAKFIDCSELCGIHYEDLDEPEALTADDVEMLMDDYFANSEEILRCFYWNGKLSEELLHTCSLEFLAMGQANFDDAEYAFPEEPVGNLDRLQVHVSKLWENPIKVVSVHVERVVKKGQRDGKTFDLDIKEVRRAIMDVYAPEDAPNLCFCQMCRRVKPQMLTEVNNLEYEPEYFFPQLRISLCLECSKRFELLRYNDKIRADYMRSIKTADIPIGHGTVDIPIGKEHKVTFTAKHLAEIQEILRRMPDDAAQRGGQQNVRSWNESSGLYPA